MDITGHIKAYLILHDRLCLPGLGTFIAVYRPAEVVKGLNVIKPPSRQIVFDADLVSGDDELNRWLAEREKITPEEAGKKINTFISNIRERINNDRTFPLQDIGTFSLKEGKICFTPLPEGLPAAEMYGLSEVPAGGKKETVETELPSRAKAKSSEKQEVSTSQQANVQAVKEKKPSVRVWALAGILVPVAGAFVFLFLVMPSMDFFQGSGQRATSEVVVQPASSVESSEIEKYVDTLGDQRASLMPVEEKAAEKKEVEVSKDKYAACKNFYLVAGSFKNKKLALRFRDRMIRQGYEAGILSSGTVNRVYIKKYTVRKEALEALEQFQSSGMNVWLLSE